MHLTRIYTEQQLTPGQQISLEPTAARHVVQVLRLRAGSNLVLFNGDGCNYTAQLEQTSKKDTVAQILSASDPEPQSILDIQLYISISKGERMDFTIQKTVELGVSGITPIFSQHGVVNLKGERLEKRQQHWHKVMISACEQSGRCRLPVIYEAMELDKLLEMPPHGLNLVLNHRADISLTEFDPPEKRINLLVGPEGGLSDGEILAAQNCGFHGVRLGPRVLRTETAPLAAIAAIQTLWGDFRYS